MSGTRAFTFMIAGAITEILIGIILLIGPGAQPKPYWREAMFGGALLGLGLFFLGLTLRGLK